MPSKTIKEINSINQLLKCLNEYSMIENQRYIFRGQTDFNWKLTSSYNREYFDISQNYERYEDMLKKFKGFMAKLGNIPFDLNDNLSWLEYAQHHGLPTPCIDFTYSPFVALFFAYDDVKYEEKNRNKYSSIYCLNIDKLAGLYIRNLFKHGYMSNYGNVKHDSLTMRLTFLNDPNVTLKPIQHDSYEILPFYKDNFLPLDIIKFLPHPNIINQRMIRQQGCFIYDSLFYSSEQNDLFFGTEVERKERNFELLLEKLDNFDQINSAPLLCKLKIPHSLIKEIFKLLEAANINATMLYLDANGVAKDVKNSVYYDVRSADVREE